MDSSPTLEQLAIIQKSICKHAGDVIREFVTIPSTVRRTVPRLRYGLSGEGPGNEVELWTANLVPRAIREPDKWPWCRLKNVQDSCTFFRLVSWEGSTGYHGIFPNMAVYGFLHSLSFSTVYASIRSRLSEERCSWCPSFLLRINGRCSWEFIRPFRNFGKLVSVTLLFTHKTISGVTLISMSAACCFTSPICSKHFVAAAFVWPHILPMLSAVRSPDNIFLSCLSIHKWPRSHES